MHLSKSIATTEESTPPDKPSNTLSLPTLSFTEETIDSIMSDVSQFFSHLQIV